MARGCSIRGSKVRVGRKIHRSGLAKKKGGIGRHVTKTVKRKVSPNLHTKRVWVPELSKYVRVKASAKELKTINKNGAYVTLKKAFACEPHSLQDLIKFFSGWAYERFEFLFFLKSRGFADEHEISFGIAGGENHSIPETTKGSCRLPGFGDVGKRGYLFGCGVTLRDD